MIRLAGKSYARKILLIGLLVGTSSLVALLVADRLLGLVLSRKMNLVFPANTTVNYETSEFKFTVIINSMGFRDREVTPKVPGRLRILAIGDSFVYGWGVEGDQAWPKVLEAELRGAGQNVEVFNLGCPGYGPTEYGQVAHRAIPALSPGMVIVAVLQGDDLMQEHLKIVSEASAVTSRHSSVVRSIAHVLAPNLILLVKGQSHLTPLALPESAVRGAYKEQVHRLLVELTAQQRSRLDAIDPAVRRMWLEGDLTPYVIIPALRNPDYFSFTLDPDRSDVKQAISRMAGCLGDIRKAAAKSAAEVVVVSVPFDAYVVSPDRRRQFGFSVPDTARTGTAQDDVIECACKLAGVRFHSVTGAFRHQAAGSALFYRYDGHFTADGHRLFADEIARLYLDHKL